MRGNEVREKRSSEEGENGKYKEYEIQETEKISTCFSPVSYGVLVINAVKLQEKLKSRSLVPLLIHVFPSSPDSSVCLKGNAGLKRCVSAPAM